MGLAYDQLVAIASLVRFLVVALRMLLNVDLATIPQFLDHCRRMTTWSFLSASPGSLTFATVRMPLLLLHLSSANLLQRHTTGGSNSSIPSDPSQSTSARLGI